MPALNIGSDLQSVLSQLPAAMKQSQEQDKTLTDLAQKEVKQIDESTAEKKKVSAEFSDVLKPPQIQHYTPPKPTGFMQAFGSPAMWIAALGSLFTRTHATTALNAMAGVMNSYAKGDEARGKQDFERWKIETDNMLKMHDFELKAYQAAMENADIDAAGTEAKIRTLAAAYKNDPVKRILDTTGSLAQVGEYLNQSARIGMDLRKARDEGDAMHDVLASGSALHKARLLPDTDPTKAQKIREAEQTFRDSSITLGAMRGSGVATAEIRGEGGSSMSMTPEEKASAAGQAATGEPLNQIIPGYGKDATAMRREIRGEAIKHIIAEHPEMSEAEAGAELARRSVEFQAGKTSVGQLNTMYGATKQAVAQLDFNIDKTREEMKKLGSTDLSPLLNGLIRGEEKWTGDPAYSGLYFYMQAVATESARILAGGQASRAQLAEGAREEAQKWANVGMTPAAFEEVAKAMHQEGEARLQTFYDARESQLPGADRGPSVGAPKTFPDPPEDAIRQLRDNPDSADQFDEIFGPGAAEKVLRKGGI